MDQALRNEVRAVSKPEDPRDRRDAADAVSTREGSDQSDEEQGRGVSGGGASAQADVATTGRARRQEVTESDGDDTSWLARLGLAIVQPRTALAIAADRRNSGRSGSDLLAAIA